jgi:DNA-directed RNA polymerase subunit RPC12/RpoP
MHREQEYRCKICKRHADEFKKGLVVDHNHKTGKVRALLCTNCNSQLHVLENKELYDKYMNYLNSHEEE